MNTERIYNLILFMLLSAARLDEWRWRELGPIHILKYLYLADVAYAARREGQSFTGIPWRFYHFGPWDEDAYASIESSIHRGGAEIRTFASVGDKDGVRYSLSDDEKEMDRLESALPIFVSGQLSKLIKEYGNDTNRLLHHVYRTEPMMHAAPHEPLDLSHVPQEVRGPRPESPQNLLSKRQRKDLKARFQEIMRRKMQERQGRPEPSAEGGAAYLKVVDFLDSLDNTPLEESEAEIEFSEETWKSEWRREQLP